MLDLALAFKMVSEEVARDLDVLIFEVEVRPEKLDEESGHLGIRVREAELVAILGPFGPIEHASCDVERLSPFSELASLLLSEFTSAPTDCRVDSSSFHVPVEGLYLECRPLFLGELYVPDPTTDGRE
jgi:hypothetical protein